MLVLSRRPGEKIKIGPDIMITVLEMRDGRVRIGIEAPRDIRIDRPEWTRPYQGGEVRGADGE